MTEQTVADQQRVDEFLLASPCAGDHHFPFRIMASRGEGGVIPYGVVRIDSYYGWDGCGGRTDLHDVLGLAWAASLRASGAASAQVWIDVGFCGSPEIGSRFMFFNQPYSSALSEKEFEPHMRRLLAHTSWAAHGLREAFHLRSPNDFPPQWSDTEKPTWVPSLADLIEGVDDGLWVSRKNPDWEYYTDSANSIVIAKLGRGAREILNHTFLFYRPKVATIGSKYVIVSNGLSNCVESATVERAEAILQRVEGRLAPKWVGPETIPTDNKLLAIPLESHCLFVGKRTIVALATPSGAAEFDRARDEWAERSARESSIFNIGVQWKWAPKLDPARFEALAEALLSEEPGLTWVRSTGPAFERDQGRDLVAMWLTPLGLGEKVTRDAAENAVQTRKIVVQAKVRSRTVGKSDVQDVRDTLERHGAGGFLLIAHPRWSNDLFNYLETLATKGAWVDIWGPSQLEERLRRRPHIARRFPDLVTEVTG